MTTSCVQCGRLTAPDADFCNHCGASLTGKKPVQVKEWQSKRERVLGEFSFVRSNKRRVIIGLAAVVAAFLIFSNLPKSGNPILKAQPVVVEKASYPQVGQPMADIQSRQENGRIIIPVDVVRQKKFVGFIYTGQRGLLPLLAYVSTEGKIVTAVSMCEPCNSVRFHIKGEELVCNSCGTKWNINDLEAISGSCGKFPPDPLPNTVVGNEIRIDEQIVANWRPRK